MARIKSFSILVLMMFLSGIVSEASARGLGSETHRVIQAQDVAAFGDTYVMLSDNSLEQESVANPQLLGGWDEAHSTVLFVRSHQSKKTAALITSASYRFSSPQVALGKLNAVLDAGKASSTKGVPVLTQDLIKQVNSRSVTWDVWYGLDSEKLPAYVFWYQSGPSITLVHISVSSESAWFGRELLNHIVSGLLNGTVAGIGLPYKAQPVSSETSNGSAGLYATTRRAYTWRVVWTGWEPHFLATFSGRNGRNPHYRGIGGDDATCWASGSGCISGWQWYVYSQWPNDSHLGVPKTWYLTWPDSHIVSNYEATVD